MKYTRHLIALASIALLPTSALAFDIGSIADKATDAIAGGGSTDLLGISTDLLKSFQGNEKAMSAAKGLMSAFNAEDYLGAFDYYDKIKNAGLKPSQLQTWNDVKNPISALILDKNFSLKDAELSELVSKASSALQSNDTRSAGDYLNQLKDAATLTPGQKDLLGEIQANLLPVK